jgi:hypothetical protein
MTDVVLVHGTTQSAAGFAALGTVVRCDLSAIYAEVPAIDPAARPSTYLLPVDDRTTTTSLTRRRWPKRWTGPPGAENRWHPRRTGR